jgi:hypothetical protein
MNQSTVNTSSGTYKFMVKLCKSLFFDLRCENCDCRWGKGPIKYRGPIHVLFSRMRGHNPLACLCTGTVRT